MPEAFVFALVVMGSAWRFGVEVSMRCTNGGRDFGLLRRGDAA